MASAPSSMYTDGHTYRALEPEEVHRDMRLDLTRALLVLNRTPAVARVHRDCPQCRTIRAEHAAAHARRDPHTYPDLDTAVIAHSERAVKLTLTRAQLARALGLPRGERVARLYVSDDPVLLHVVVCGEHYPPVVDGTEIPAARGARWPG